MIKQKWDAIVLDLDGTLVDTLQDIANAANAALKNNGFKMWTVEQYRYMVGNGVRKLIERATGGADTDTIERVMADYNSIYSRDCLKFTAPYDKIPETLIKLKESGIYMFVVTNKPDAQAKKIVSHLFGETFFQGVYGTQTGRKNKPDPTVTLNALASVGCKPDRSLFVGDSDVDMYTAANAGLKGAGALWGFRGREELMAAGADYLLESPAQILHL
ncbi:MAG: HAD family hydrolase [Oscillospiraceae bacterium]|jgi:phosphoglycolate phosphatase|nr:HAD family hydrolase [Oscillospiraceae bacterium]